MKDIMSVCVVNPREVQQHLSQSPDVQTTFEMVYMDLTGPLSTTEEGPRYISSVTDVLTQFLVAVPTAGQETREVDHAPNSCCKKPTV